MVLTKTTLDKLGFVGRGRSRHRPRNDQSLFNGKYPFIQTGEVKAANLYISSYESTYNEKGLAQSKLWNENTLLITIAANIADTAILKIKACFPDSIVAFIPYEGVSDVKYIKYYIDYIKLELQAISRGTTQDNMSLDKLLTRPMYVPDYNYQKKIASVLSAYDDLIENNNQRIQLLEDMAQEIYKEWFVRFRFPDYQNTTFVDKDGNQVPHGTKGAIPEGWERARLPKYVDFLEGPGLRNYQYTESGIHYLNIRVMGHNELNLDKAGFLDSDEVHNRYPHFMLRENDHVVSSSGTIGRVVTIRDSHLPLCLNTSIIRMRKKEMRFGTWLLKQYLKSPDFQNQITSFAIGAAQANFGPSHLSLMKATIPSEKTALMFEGLVGPMEEEIKILLDKNQVLQDTRDLLLPRLISGKLSVDNIALPENQLQMAAEPSENYK